MTFGVMLAVLGAAFLHALWNAMIKVGTSKIGAMVVLSVMEVPIGLAVVATRPLPAPEVWPWVMAAGCTHFAYKFFLTYAYEQGDLSRVYPIARGAAPMIVAIVGALFLADAMRAAEYAGITVLGLGIGLMARGVFADGESRRLLPFALGSAAATASYTLIDGLGARVSGDAVAYVGWIFVVDGLLFAAGMVALRGRVVLAGGWRGWALGGVASAASYGAYAISVWAMTVAPIALVAALRETSILFAVLIGWLVFGERMTPGKALAAALIVLGVALTRL
ncbi:peptide ABC transporter permease [Rhodobacter veldkampii DSM 11550]|uniref:Peptide ABC transporter permease n=1 Tax=Phaeovulum veldkampii DSM 11550 TaxID=1185920 RepID=A0A2T4JHX3_9RHOB|nr:DMT family transporter [Phaeovulum veldkampii]MBK5945593.1 peptide ABC transporter permease [Phaeovulum veldkampii DSM 11550]PTE17520.1 peptide ABC transporter permease [Phaeovulum veldkampii DSM 11550]TDQ60190.1 EamA-like transporter family protein [Phaeovulum veldkampii DSM 11550]